MKTKALIAAALTLGLVAAPAAARDNSKAEARLAKKLDGRVAGEPVKCLNIRRISSSQVYDRTAILYKVGSTYYVNRPEAGANSLRRHDIMVTKPTTGQLCSIDTVTMRDSHGFYSGNVFLGEFVPYRLPERG